MMRHKLIALVLALTAVSWAQTATQTATSTSPQNTAPSDAKACPGCNKMASADMQVKDGPACCMRHAKATTDGKEPACCAGKDKAACCSGKDAKSCKRNRADKTAVSCCSNQKCGGDCEKACSAGKQGE